jgi:nicotinate-nucleotide adenylyltransferase
VKIILFGGSFDPPHRGHLEILKECSQYRYDKLILMPSYESPLKSIKTKAEHRLNMLNCLIDGLDFPIEISSWEINGNKKSFTYLTIHYLMNKYPNASISLVIGSDQLLQFEKWKNYKFILENSHIICFRRHDEKIKFFKNMSISWNKQFKIDISSTQIRNDISQGVKITDQLPSLVLKYIKNNKLYGA